LRDARNDLHWSVFKGRLFITNAPVLENSPLPFGLNLHVLYPKTETMFKAPFSFNGRIRRKEYGLSILACWAVMMVAQLTLIGFGEQTTQSTGTSLIFLLIVIPIYYFIFAQGAKRCHDRGNSGWFQLIPFYGLWMLFADGEPGQNQFGENPKGIGNEHFSFESHNEEVSQ
jgi:uncharacterized membrane protein YhaH (DUF805 family)